MLNMVPEISLTGKLIHGPRPQVYRSPSPVMHPHSAEAGTLRTTKCTLTILRLIALLFVLELRLVYARQPIEHASCRRVPPRLPSSISAIHPLSSEPLAQDAYRWPASTACASAYGPRPAPAPAPAPPPRSSRTAWVCASASARRSHHVSLSLLAPLEDGRHKSSSSPPLAGLPCRWCGVAEAWRRCYSTSLEKARFYGAAAVLRGIEVLLDS
ncbi:hypothetical protein B0H13DRAFT_2567654 [Mycena leptocephala]|nr:hypothetical protein B0H13DRAFT_2567654 [Mycena leptocephala]